MAEPVTTRSDFSYRVADHRPYDLSVGTGEVLFLVGPRDLIAALLDEALQRHDRGDLVGVWADVQHLGHGAVRPERRPNLDAGHFPRHGHCARRNRQSPDANPEVARRELRV